MLAVKHLIVTKKNMTKCLADHPKNMKYSTSFVSNKVFLEHFTCRGGLRPHSYASIESKRRCDSGKKQTNKKKTLPLSWQKPWADSDCQLHYILFFIPFFWHLWCKQKMHGWRKWKAYLRIPHAAIHSTPKYIFCACKVGAGALSHPASTLLLHTHVPPAVLSQQTRSNNCSAPRSEWAAGEDRFWQHLLNESVSAFTAGDITNNVTAQSAVSRHLGGCSTAINSNLFIATNSQQNTLFLCLSLSLWRTPRSNRAVINDEAVLNDLVWVH